jgi:hypothetical protein
MTDDTALALTTGAERALAEARTVADFQAVRDTAEGLRAYAKSRGMGVEAENMAATVILQAERGIGAELDRMSEAGERRARGSNQHHSKGDEPPGLPELGISMKQAHLWRALAKLWTDEQFEQALRVVRATGERIAKVDFYRGPKTQERVQRQAMRDIEEELAADDASPLVDQFELAANVLAAGLQQLPNDELERVAAIIGGLVADYQRVRRARA